MALNREVRAQLARLGAAVETMEALTRAVFLLHRLERLDYPEIGERLGLSVGEVERRIAAAMLYLVRAMDDAEGEGRAG